MHVDLSFHRAVRSEHLQPLLAQCTWASQRTSTEIQQSLDGSYAYLGGWMGDRLVAFARVISDGCFRALIDDVVVDKDFRGRGLGSQLMHALLDQLATVEEVFLRCDDEVVPFYRRCGFADRATCLDWIERPTTEFRLP